MASARGMSVRAAGAWREHATKATGGRYSGSAFSGRIAA
jgi:hypothetical protein